MTPPSNLVVGRWQDGKRTLRYGSAAHGFTVEGYEVKGGGGFSAGIIQAGDAVRFGPWFRYSHQAQRWFMDEAKKIVGVAP